MRITAEPRSDQWNADDFIGGPRTFTIAGVRAGTAEQKYDIQLVEGEGRSWRPPLTMLRLLIAAWGDDSALWSGRQVTLFRDPNVTFGKDNPGGIRVSHLSHIDKPLAVSLTAARGRRSLVKVEPLKVAAPPSQPSPEQIAALTDLEELKVMWGGADEVTRPLIEARAAELKAVQGG